MPGHPSRILIVDDEKDFCDVLFHVLRTEGFDPIVANNGETALEMIRLGMPDVVLLDVKMHGMDGMEVLKRSKGVDPDLPIIMVTAYGGVDGAVRSIKNGAYDYLSKPVNNRELVQKINKAIGTMRGVPKQSVPYREGQDQTIDSLRAMMGPSEVVQRIVSEIATVACSHFSVVIQGETGTGKELVARAIHRASPRSEMPFIAVDCGAIPETLFESELFGHEKGAFTGAVQTRPGKFEMAHRGTLFLDELANMSKSMQVKLLRSIQERSFFRVGGQKPVKVNLRILVATNQDLCAAAAKGGFSRDLFYRLSEFTISIPPLRDRKEDIVHLSTRFLQATNVELGKNVRGFSESATALILAYHWPGNVRQLKSVVRRAVLQSDEVISPQHLALEDFPMPAPNFPPIGSDIEWEGQPLKEIVRLHTIDLERRVLTQALRKTGGNKAKAARLLHIDYKTMHTKVKEYGIKIDSEDENGKKN